MNDKSSRSHTIFRLNVSVITTNSTNMVVEKFREMRLTDDEYALD
jgi:hypothetical protein